MKILFKSKLILYWSVCMFLPTLCLKVVAQENISPDFLNIEERNSDLQKSKPYLIMICADGFRYDYATKFNTFNLLALAAKGIQADRMIPSYPTVTHPNHFTMLSGLYPGHTGIVGNSFYDPQRKEFYKAKDGSWFNEEPVWATAQKQQMLTANFRWVGANLNLKGTQVSYNYKMKKEKGSAGEQGANFVKQMLGLPEEKRPHLILMYFGDTDHQGHQFGTEANETRIAAKDIDEAVGLINGVAEKSGLPVNFMFVSDHGMANIDKKPIPVPTIDSTKFVVSNQNPLVNIYAKDRSAILETYKRLKSVKQADYDVFLSKDIPAEFHYGGKDDRYNRVGDIVLIARFPKTFNPKPGAAAHGYNPFTIKEMGATFFAWGPLFKSGLKTKEFKNIELYNVITSILKIKGNPSDGDGSYAAQILVK